MRRATTNGASGRQFRCTPVRKNERLPLEFFHSITGHGHDVFPETVLCRTVLKRRVRLKSKINRQDEWEDWSCDGTVLVADYPEKKKKIRLLFMSVNLFVMIVIYILIVFTTRILTFTVHWNWSLIFR